MENNYKWNFKNLYCDTREWKEDLNKLRQISTEIFELKNKLNTKSGLESYLELDKKFNYFYSRLFLYNHLLDLDQTNQNFQILNSLLEQTMQQINSELSFIEPEFLENDESHILKLVQNSSNPQYYNYFCKMFSDKKHYLDSNGEKLINNVSKSRTAAESIYSTLAYADKTEESITFNKKTRIVNSSLFKEILETSDPINEQTLRQNIWDLYYKNYTKNKYSFAKIYENILAFHFENSKIRNYKSALELSLSKDQVNTTVYEKLLEVGKENIDILRNYYKLIKNHFKLKRFYVTDRELNLGNSFSKNFSIDEGKEIVEKALAQLGPEYQNNLNTAIKHGNIDYYENANKVSGAYSTGAVDYDPVILMNWDNKLNSLSTLAHELGHSVHTLFADQNNQYPLNDYPILLAEVASTFNEHIFFDCLLEKTSSNDEKIYLIQQRLFDLFSTFFRQIQFAEFEFQAHNLYQNGEPLTAEVLADLFKKVENSYGYDVFDDSERDTSHWPFISHIFEAPFYVYKYAVDLVASYKLYDDYKKGDLKIIQFLKAGGSKPPLEILAGCGVDFSKKSTYKPLIDEMQRLLMELEKLIK